MFQRTLNNWLDFCYDNDNDIVRRTDPNQKLNIQIKRTNDPISDFRTECIKATQSLKDTYSNEKLCLMFSGGSESEMMLRSFKEAGLNFKVYIGRYNNDLNLYDISYAVVICEALNIPYKILDFDVLKFFENDVYDYSLKAQIVIPPMLVQLALCNMVDGLPIMAGGEMNVERTDNDYTKKGTWYITEWEYNVGWPKYFNTIGRPAVPDWCRWTPNQFCSIFQTQWFKKIINDEYFGKLGISSTKIYGYREAWPELVPRIKKHGMEDIQDLMDSVQLELIKFNNLESFGGDRSSFKISEGHPLLLEKFKNNFQYWTEEEFMLAAKG